MIKLNENNMDRWLRVILGVALVALGLVVMQSGWGILVAVVGLIPLITGVVGFCPLYAILGLSTSRVRS